MSPSATRILVVGEPCASTTATLSHLEREGWAAHCTKNIVKAKALLETIQVDVVLAEENLPDGRGYDLTDTVERLSVTLLVSVALSESCLWLPVVESGERSLGRRALHPRALDLELEMILSGARNGVSRAYAKRELPPRRKTIATPASSAAPPAKIVAAPQLVASGKR